MSAGTFASASAKSANVVVVNPASTNVSGALKPSGRPSNFTDTGPSKPSMRVTVTFTGSAPPFHTAGAGGVKLTAKSGFGGRTVTRYAWLGPALAARR